MADKDWVDVDENWTDVAPQLSPMEAFRNYINTAPQRAEQGITNRSSVIANLIQDPTTLQRFMQHPLGTSLRTLGGAWELAEGIPADVLMKLNKPSQIIPDIQKTLMGQRPAQYGDFLRSGGVPEPLAATGGLLATGIKGTPTAALGEITTKPVVNLATKVINKTVQLGKPAIAGFIQFLTNKGIPARHAAEAMENPTWLNKGWANAEEKVTNSLSRNVITPLENDKTAMVNVSSAKQLLKQMDLVRGNEPTPQVAELSPTQQSTIKKWLLEIKGNTEMSFNRTRFLLREMDKYLKPVYRQTAQGEDAVSADKFQQLTGVIRGTLRSMINNNNFPEANQALDRISYFKHSQDVANSFKDFTPSLWRTLYGKILLVGVGIKSIPAAGMALPFTMPATWGGIIRGGAGIENIINKNPSMFIPAIRKSMESNQGDWVNVD